MKLTPQVTKTTDFIFRHFSEDIGSVLIWTTIGGWIASSAAQICGIWRNPNYTKEQKSFMIPQELGDASMNILTFFAITMPLKKLANKLVKTGKIIPRKLISQIARHGDSHKIGTYDFDIPKLPYFQSGNIAKTYNSFHNFMSTTAAVVGGVVSSNIVTPHLRNRIASKRQNQTKLKLDFIENSMQNNIPLQKQNKPTPSRPIDNSPFDRFKTHVMSI